MSAADLRTRFRRFVRERELLRDGDSVVVGVSGGVDSVTLLYLLRDHHRPVPVHLDYGLRPTSPADAAFVEDLAAGWGMEAIVRRVGLPEGENVQAAARRARYEAFEQVALEHQTPTVAVGHQRDDVAETLLLHLVRGAGPRGWAALPVQRPLRRGSRVRLVRPLRFAHRAEVEAFARSEGLTWREDPSNVSAPYRRNVMRNEVLPLLERRFGPQVAQRLADAAERMEAYLESGAALAAEGDFRAAERDRQSLALDALGGQPEPVRLGVILEALRRWAPDAPRSAAVARAVEALMQAQPGRTVELPGITIWREREALRFVPADVEEPFEAPVSIGSVVETPWGELHLTPVGGVPHDFASNPNVEVVDADGLAAPLRLRTWRSGDTIRPLGMDGTKNVSDLLTERRVPTADRRHQLVLEAAGEVVWVVGHRLAESAAVRSGTRRAVRLEWIGRS